MLILLVGLAFLILSFSSYSLAFQINGINRVVVYTPISIFESSILHNTSDDEPEILFTRDLVKQKLDMYYSLELAKFTDNFSYEIYFYNKEDESMCVEEECDAVELSFSAYLMFDYHYSRKLNFEVFETKYGS